jgi:hypothetical protein
MINYNANTWSRPLSKTFFLLWFILTAIVSHQQDTTPAQITDTTKVGVFSTETDSIQDTDEDDAEVTEKSDSNHEEFFSKRTIIPAAQDSLKVRAVPDSIIRAMKNDDAFWYANHDFKKKDTPQNNSLILKLVSLAWFRTLVWFLIIAGFTAVVIWYLISSNASIFRRSPYVIASATEDPNSENIFEINFESEINKTIATGQYRLAVRLMFLRMLKNLSEKNIIQYKQDKTNLDYLTQVQPTSYYKDFFRLTRNYEYTWYGKFDLSQEAFTIIKNDFETFRNKTH